MSLASIPDMEDDTQEYPTTNAIRICNDSIPSYHSCKNLPIINSFSEIREDFSFVRINSLDRIRMNFKSKLTIALPFDGINKTETENKEFNRNSDASMEELLPTDELTVSPNLQQFVSVVRQYNLIPASSYQRKEHMELLKNVGELIRNAMVQDGVLLPYCETIHFTFGGFWENFEKQGTLGQGCAGVVSKCCRKSNPTEEYAVKVVNTNGDEELMLKTVQEYKNYRKLFHRNIVNVYELHIDLTNKKTYMLMELVKGRELQSHLASRTRFDEKTASHIMRELMSGIEYLHSRGVVHRDIKPENIMISEDYEIVKIADLNVSKFFDSKHYLYFPDRKNNFQMWTYTGTPAFLPPEVFIDLEYSEGIDVWGAGVVLYTMLSGKLPFKSEYQEDLINKIKLAEVKFHGLIWHTISNEAKDLVLKLLHKDSNIRSSPTEALTHPWLLHKTKKALYNNSPMLPIKNELLCSKNTTPKLLQFLEQFLVPKKTMTL